MYPVELSARSAAPGHDLINMARKRKNVMCMSVKSLLSSPYSLTTLIFQLAVNEVRMRASFRDPTPVHHRYHHFFRCRTARSGAYCGECTPLFTSRLLHCDLY